MSGQPVMPGTLMSLGDHMIMVEAGHDESRRYRDSVFSFSFQIRAFIDFHETVLIRSSAAIAESSVRWRPE